MQRCEVKHRLEVSTRAIIDTTGHRAGATPLSTPLYAAGARAADKMDKRDHKTHHDAAAEKHNRKQVDPMVL
jgi:hypothetical protein